MEPQLENIDWCITTLVFDPNSIVDTVEVDICWNMTEKDAISAAVSRISRIYPIGSNIKVASVARITPPKTTVEKLARVYGLIN